jgi:hypothetical protein
LKTFLIDFTIFKVVTPKKKVFFGKKKKKKKTQKTKCLLTTNPNQFVGVQNKP